VLADIDTMLGQWRTLCANGWPALPALGKAVLMPQWQFGTLDEARRAFDSIGWPALHDVFDGNADLAVAAAAVRELLAE
jgi:hypothetical protein